MRAVFRAAVELAGRVPAPWENAAARHALASRARALVSAASWPDRPRRDDDVEPSSSLGAEMKVALALTSWLPS